MSKREIYPTVVLKKGKEQSLRRFHPWVFSGAVERCDDSLSDGDVVRVCSSTGEFLGVGHYQKSSIMVRILSFDDIDINSDFWDDALSAALRLRKALALVDNRETTCYRLVHGEGDSLPGLIVDIYGNCAVIQTHSAGMSASLSDIATALQALYEGEIKAIYHKSTSGQEGADGYLYKSDDYTDRPYVLENGIKFRIDWERGQKTGFFIDQRDNRNLLRSFATGKRVLNLFCYTGGFSLYALSGGAQFVDSVDTSEPALAMAMENMAINGFATTEATSNSFICDDAIKFLREAPQGKYNLMVVDPPAFAKHLSAKQEALRAYKKLNALAIERIERGGVIFTFSCSQVVGRQDFALAVFSAAAIAHRRVKIIARLTQPADHPVNIFHPEGEYLKGLVLYVEK